uniref:Portal protein n=1 Tax=viral metagenome TaxID=1070528 RepID=A0A6M3J5C4_9ZZZZ
MDKKPTKQWIQDQLQSLHTHYSARNMAFNLDDVYYELLFRDQLGLPEEYKEDGVVLPTARDIVDAGTNHVSTVYARFMRPSRGVGKDATDQAEMLRKFDTAMFYRTKMESDISPWRNASKHGCQYGMWCFESLYNPDKLPEEPEQRDGESDMDFQERMDIYNGELYDALPIVVRAVHPQNVYPDPNGEFVIIEESKTLMQAKSEWSNLAIPLTTSGIVQGTGTYHDVTQVTYFDKQYRAIYVNQIPALTAANEDGVIEHDYGHIPYVIGYSGLGSADKSAKPEKQAVGLIRYLRSLLRSESFAYSVYNIILKSHSWPITFVSGPGAAALTTIKMKFGKIYEKPAGVTIEDYVKAPPSDMVMQHMEYTASILAASAAPRSVRGLPEAGVRSGTDRAQIISEARLRYDSILEQMQLTTAKVMSNCTKIAERVVPEDFHIWAKAPDEEIDFRIDRSKIRHHYTTFVEFTPVSPEEEARRHADAMNSVKSGVMSTHTARKRYWSHIDTEAEDIRVEAEKLRNSQPVMEVMAQMVAQELMGEVARLGKIKALQSGQTAQVGVGQPGQAISPQAQGMQGMMAGPGMAQALGAMMRQRQGTYRPAQPGSPEELAAQMAQAGQPSTGGGLRVPGTPIQSPTPYGQVRLR